MWKWYKSLHKDDGDIYMSRWQILRTPWLSIYVNKICRPDADPWLHTHPWRRSWSLKLWNSYVEQVPSMHAREYRVYRYRVPRRWSEVPYAHRIAALLDNKPVWTLFIGWHSNEQWGYINPETKELVPSDVRHKQRGLV
jgi:hypothetical protein